MTLAIRLLAAPTRLAMAERAAFSVGIEVTNRGVATIDPKLSTECQLAVNGAESMAWNLAIGNGAREKTWYALPPGATIAMSWPLGNDLFTAPGRYHLVITLAGQQATGDVEVTP